MQGIEDTLRQILLAVPCNMLRSVDALLHAGLQFDRVLCDVPCCGDGTLRKDTKVWKVWHPGYGVSLHSLQLQIAMRGISLMKVGGCVVDPVRHQHPSLAPTSLQPRSSLAPASPSLAPLRLLADRLSVCKPAATQRAGGRAGRWRGIDWYAG